MGIYGIDNVRGGIYVTEALDGLERYTIKKSIWGANDCCTQCGRKGHFIKNCKAIKDVNGEDIYEECDNCDNCDNQYENKSDCEKHEKIFKCRYCNKIFETQKGTIFHENIHCKSKKSNKKNNCYRCGRCGHYSNECYAKTDIDGYYLDSD